jgi:hypothetical protein
MPTNSRVRGLPGVKPGKTRELGPASPIEELATGRPTQQSYGLMLPKLELPGSSSRGTPRAIYLLPFSECVDYEIPFRELMSGAGERDSSKVQP